MNYFSTLTGLSGLPALVRTPLPYALPDAAGTSPLILHAHYAVTG